MIHGRERPVGMPALMYGSARVSSLIEGRNQLGSGSRDASFMIQFRVSGFLFYIREESFRAT
jgi:hypothetical protein